MTAINDAGGRNVYGFDFPTAIQRIDAWCAINPRATLLDAIRDITREAIDGSAQGR